MTLLRMLKYALVIASLYVLMYGEECVAVRTRISALSDPCDMYPYLRQVHTC